MMLEVINSWSLIFELLWVLDRNGFFTSPSPSPSPPPPSLLIYAQQLEKCHRCTW
jgi:hypothetical protein